MTSAGQAIGAAALLCTLAVSGCTAEANSPTPAPMPTAPVSESPTETAQERQERLDYAAAEKAYRTFRAEYERVLRAGGAEKPTRLMRETATGKYLNTFTEVIQGFELLGSRHEGAEKIVYVRPGGYEPKSLVLKVCEDSRGVTTVREPGKDERGGIIQATVEVRVVDGKWKLSDGTGKSVTSCDD